MEFFIPPDNEELRKHYEPRYGVCGPAAIAALMRMSVYQIMSEWPGGYKGWGPMKDMQAVLEKLRIPFVWMRGMKAKKFPRPETGCAIVRVQWLKDDGTEYYWAAATCHTHYVLLMQDKKQATLGNERGLWWAFCNGRGWFILDKKEDEYLKLGYVSSYLEITC